jgi:transcription-repair coupling factor (superfamily II helicase)
MKNMPVKTHLEVNIDLPWEAYLPREYVPGQKLRIEVYRRLSRIRSHESLEDFQTELRDRYGPIPEVTEWLVRLADLRLLATHWQIASIHLEGKGLEGTEGPVDVVIGYRHPRKIETLAKRSGGRLVVVDKESAYLRTKPHERDPMSLFRLLQHALRLPDKSV